jgi:4-hydroxy-4-methyl-2-oxoglutarate aldolase
MYAPEEMKKLAGELYSAVLSDVLDDLGYRQQIMRHDIRPVFDGAVVFGRALTVLAVDVYEVRPDPYDKEIASTDALRPGDVLVVSTNGSTRIVYWGELLSTAAQVRGGHGAVIDGLTRDVRRIQAMGFPVFARGYKPMDSKGRGLVVDYNCPLQCGDVRVHPGDLVFGDFDGVVVIPAGVAERVVDAALEKVGKEDRIRAELRQGKSLRAVFDKYGIL